MAGMVGAALVTEEALAAATTETVIQLVAAANHAVKVLRWRVAFDGTSVTAEPVLVEVLRQTTAGTASSLALVKFNDSNADSFDTTAQQDFTVEPSAGDVLERVNVHPQGGYEMVYPLGQEIIIGAGDRLGLRCTAPAIVNVAASFYFEE